MRLINCTTLKFEEVVGRELPPYAILSHTWGKYEITFKDYVEGDGLRTRLGSDKILKTCEIALQAGYPYVWIDTCCIDKSSSAELTEAINSMFNYYKRAERCIVYLSDFDSEDPNADFSQCRWFARGWTLQELIAPLDVRFYDAKWRYYGAKRDLAPEIARITGISSIVISSGRFTAHRYSVAERMSWAAQRETTREEDLAYCLFGIFEVNLPLLYGEGSRAFIRLQEEIVRNSNDLTVFAWQAKEPSVRGIFARSPSEFTHAKGILSWPLINPEYAVTNRGLRIETHLIKGPSSNRAGNGSVHFMSLWCRRSDMPKSMHIGIWLKSDWGYYYRIKANELPVQNEQSRSEKGAKKLLYIVRDVEANDTSGARLAAHPNDVDWDLSSIQQDQLRESSSLFWE